MARANRVRGGGRERGIFRITHRCHNRGFLLKFPRDRDAYRDTLREHVKKDVVWLSDYSVTSNHVHLLLDAEERLEVSGFMQGYMGIGGADDLLRARKRGEKRVKSKRPCKKGLG